MNSHPIAATKSIKSILQWASLQDKNDWYRRNLRTNSLLPDPDFSELFLPESYDRTIVFDSVEHIKRARSRITDESSFLEDSVFDFKYRDGRLLLYRFGETTFTCTPKDMTEGFFDEYDLPPWDLWVCFVPDIDPPDRYFAHYDGLLSWIPADLVDNVNSAVRASFEENIVWGDRFFELLDKL